MQGSNAVDDGVAEELVIAVKPKTKTKESRAGGSIPRVGDGEDRPASPSWVDRPSVTGNKRQSPSQVLEFQRTRRKRV